MQFTVKVLLLLTIGFSSVGLFAQKKQASNFNEGIIKYVIEVEGTAEFAQFVDNSAIYLYLKGENSKMDFNIMGGLANFQLINNMNDDLFTLMMDVPAFYEKTAISFDENSNLFDEIEVTKNRNKAPQKEMVVEYFKNKKKKIAKYLCYKAVLSAGPNENDKLTMYLTDKLRPQLLSKIEESIGYLDGFPLGFEIMIDDITVKIVAEEVLKQDIETNSFVVPNSYTLKSLEQFKEELQKKFGTGSDVIRL